MALSDEDVAQIVEALAPLLADLIAASVREAVRRDRHSMSLLPASVSSVDGPDAVVLPDGNDSMITVTRLSTPVAEDARVMLLFAPSGQAVALGAIPE